MYAPVFARPLVGGGDGKVRKAALVAMAALCALALAAAGCGSPAGGQQPADQGQQTADRVAGGQQPADQGQQTADRVAGGPGGDPANGRNIYASRCAACHGADGAGGIGPAFVAKGRNPAVADRLSEADHIKVVTDGRNAMPAFKSQLSDQEIKDVVAYERSLR